ncbi:MAG: hypothetical protein V3W04_15190 [Gammaproteobacteria bacterium]
MNQKPIIHIDDSKSAAATNMAQIACQAPADGIANPLLTPPSQQASIEYTDRLNFIGFANSISM